MSRVAHAYPVACANPVCGTIMHEGLMTCARCWCRLTVGTRHRLLITMEAWKGGGSVQPYLSARDAALAEIRGVTQ